MRHSPEIRDVIDTITTKVVLILGRFTDERLSVLQALREELQKRDYITVLPLLHESGEAWGMFASIQRRGTVLPIVPYSGESELIGRIQSDVIEIAERKVIELEP